MRKFLAFLGAVIATVSLAGGAGASAASKPSGPDLSSPTAIASYLTSKGIDPSTVVTQTGLNNYAGPNCPGLGWTCTTSTRVVQLAAPGGQNVAICTTPFTGECVAIQQSDTKNTFTCEERTAPVQHCMITQAGTRNFARVDQYYSDNSPASDAVQTAHVSQTGATDKNELQLYQEIDQKTSGGGTQSQDAHQFVVLEQAGTGTANNFAHVHQGQNQDEGGSAAEQNQNTAEAPTILNADAAYTAAHCASLGGVTDANLCARFDQYTDEGNNDAHLHQLGSQEQKSSADAAQQQGSPYGGEAGSLDQNSGPNGTNLNESVQHKQQHAKSNGGFSTQYDPVRCCGVSQNGGAHDRNGADQLTVQSASGGTYNQVGHVTGETDAFTGGGDASTASASALSGMAICSVSQHVRQNDAGNNVTDNESGPFCDAFAQSTCTSSNVSTTPGDVSNAAASDQCVAPDLATNGADLPAFDVTADPPSYSLPSWYENF